MISNVIFLLKKNFIIFEVISIETEQKKKKKNSVVFIAVTKINVDGEKKIEKNTFLIGLFNNIDCNLYS